MSNDTSKLNKPQASGKINCALPDLETCMQRLAVISKQTSASAIMRWLGLPEATHSNWKRRNSINYDRVIEGLLRQGVSLDWFFAPAVYLRYPNVSSIVTEQDADYEVPAEFDAMLKALDVVEPIMQQYGVLMTESNRKLMTELFFKRRGEGVVLETALHQVAKALATAQAK
ncbi:helix-turn-helix domain-containing protein [Pseudidiomarina donghaiensis]|nr:helix-turn-helix domain-containing protein [Pseudidiomarina donghaiensis]SFV21417.1 Bacteriophage CI repressor helix-turn-helix domain-containing protein [Pseudidiomarina donghaiensis]